MKEENEIKVKIAIAALGAGLGFTLGLIYLSGQSPIGESYRKEVISLLEKYKDRKIDSDEAGERLYDISQEVWNEYKRSEGKEAEELHDLWSDITDINVDIYHHGYASDENIDKAIKEIKE